MFARSPYRALLTPPPPLSPYRALLTPPPPLSPEPEHGAMLSSLLLGLIALPVGLRITWFGMSPGVGYVSIPARDLGLVVACGLILTGIAILRLVAAVRLLRNDTRASASAHSAARYAFCGELSLLVLVLVLGGYYGLIFLVFLSPYVIPSILQSITLEQAAVRLGRGL